MNRFVKCCFLFTLLSTVCLAQTPVTGAAQGTNFHRTGIVPVITHSQAMPARPQPGNAGPENNGIQYIGGPVMNAPGGVTAYYIWYGDWSGNTANDILPDFVAHLGGSPYYKINTTYYGYEEGEKKPMGSQVRYGGSLTDYYSYGKALTDNDVGNVIANAVTSGGLPADPNGVYFVLTSADSR